MNLIENIKLNEEEQRTYAELFKACDVENYGKVSGNIAYNLFLTAGLSQETLTQVATLCGSRGLGHLGRAEFYVAVKLIAAAQCGFPVVVESLGAEVPLPKFHQFTGYERNQAGYFHPQMSDVTAEQDRNRMVNQQAMSSNIMMQAYPQQQQQPQASSTMPQQQAPQQTMTHQQQAAQQPPQQQTMPQQTMPQQPQQVMSHQNAMPHPQQMQHQNAQQMVHQNSLQQPQQQQPQPPQQQHQAAMPQQPQMPPHSAMVTQQQQHAATTQQHVLPSQMSVGGIGLPPPPHAKQRSTAATAASGAAHLVRNQSVDQQQQVYPGSSGGGGGSGGSEDPTVSPPTFSPRHTPPPPMSPDAASRTAPAMPDYPANHPAGSHGALRAQPSIDSTGTNAQQYATQQGFQTYEPQQQQPQQQPHAPKIEKPWTSFDDDDDDKGLITEESTQWANFPDTSRAPDTLSISSEAESLDDVWSITEEQREYYLQQFQKMQKDLTSVISGPVAKQFFEKSKLPVAELSKIWYLSDMDRDGALSLEEFCTAMHLVVLRRNDIELPDDLPPALMPYSIVTNTEEPFASDLPQSQQLNLAPSEGADSPGASGAAVVKHVDSPTSPSNTTQWTATFPPSSASSSAGGGAGGGVGAAVSPSSSSVSSPGSRPAPANFEFKPITADSDSTIIHPVALRMSPDGQPITVGNDPLDQRHVHLNNGEGNSMTSSYMHRYGSSADHDGGGGGGSSTRIPHHSGGPPGGAGSGLSAGHHEVETTDTLIDLSNGASATTASTAATESTRDLPPAVPQRKNTPEMMLDTDTHHPSATTMQHTTSGAPPPHTRQHHFSAVDGASGNFADFSRFESIPSQEVLHTPAAAPTDHHHPPPRDHLLRVVTDRGGGGPPHGATAADANMPEKHRRSVSIDYKQFSTSSFGTSKEATQQDIDALYASAGAGAEILQKLPSQTSSEADQAAQPPQLLMRQASRDRKDFHSAIRKQKERNTMLSRLNSELNQELQEVMEQRIALEIQLEHLRPFSS